MNDFGEPYPKSSCGCDDCRKSNEEKEGKKHYPRETFTAKQLPELDDADIDDEVILTIKAKVCAIRKGNEYEFEVMREGEDENETRVTLKLLSGKATVKSGKKDEDVEDMKEAKSKDANDFGEPESYEEED